MKKIVTLLTLVTLLTGCVTTEPQLVPEPPRVLKSNVNQLNQLPPPAQGKVVAAVYAFTDKTGQRKPSEKMANISTAVTQGAEVWVIKALQEVGNGQWFQVVERVGLDNLTKERQIIRQARESVGDQRQLKPMMFAGVIIEGGIIGYDSNILTGGEGARIFGFGSSTQYRQDVVTVFMRAVSVQTGEILVSVSTTKTILSTGTSNTVFKFFDMGTQSFEAEFGRTVNEPVNFAVRRAIEQSVVELIQEGARKQYWAFKEEVAKDELVQTKASAEGAAEAPSTSETQSDSGKDLGRDQGKGEASGEQK